MIQIFPITNIPIFKTEQQFWETIQSKLVALRDGDILVCAHTPLSRIKGYLYTIEEINPSKRAIQLAKELHKDPRHLEIILRESVDIVKYGRNVIITENRAGVICANAGVDQSNAGLGKVVVIPQNPDNWAMEIKDYVKEKLEKDIAVIISDTTGRALRRGAINIAIGVAGLAPMRSEIGKIDLFGYQLRVSEIAIADELASAAELVQGQTNEGHPFVVIRGYEYKKTDGLSAKILNRPASERLFK